MFMATTPHHGVVGSYPRATRGNKGSIYMLGTQPVRDMVRDEFQAIITFHILSSTIRYFSRRPSVVSS